jgi:hypothetical protein
MPGSNFEVAYCRHEGGTIIAHSFNAQKGEEGRGPTFPAVSSGRLESRQCQGEGNWLDSVSNWTSAAARNDQ